MISIRMPGMLLVGNEALKQLEGMAAKHEHVAVITDQGIRNAGLLADVMEQLKGCAEVHLIDSVMPEPTREQAEAVIQAFRATRATLLIAVGGGSVMDTAKLCSILADGAVSLNDLIADPSKAKKTVQTIMIPTTAGTGAEATPNAIVTLTDQQVKQGIVCPEMIADAVMLVPKMIRRLPQPIAAAAGVDALAHALECYTSKKANQVSDLFAMEAMKLIYRTIVSACNEQDENAQEAMLLAAYYAGLAITGSGTTAVHALSYPLGGKYHVPHGVANAILLLPVMRFNYECCKEKFAAVARNVGLAAEGMDEEQAAGLLLEKTAQIIKDLKIPSDYSAWGVNISDLEALVEAGMKVTRLLNNNMRTVTTEDARALYKEVIKP